MNRTWLFRYVDFNERDEMTEVIRDLAEAGHTVAVDVRSPAGALLVRGDPVGIMMAKTARPVRFWR